MTHGPARLALVGALLLAGAVGGPARAACLDPEDPPPVVDVPTLTVTLRAERATYLPGEVAVLPVQVRVGGADGAKVAGARVAIEVLRQGHRLTTLYVDTDASGAARPRLVVPRTGPKGPLTATATARVDTVPSYDCRSALVAQSGRITVDPLLRVR